MAEKGTSLMVPRPWGNFCDQSWRDWRPTISYRNLGIVLSSMRDRWEAAMKLRGPTIQRQLIARVFEGEKREFVIADWPEGTRLPAHVVQIIMDTWTSEVKGSQGYGDCQGAGRVPRVAAAARVWRLCLHCVGYLESWTTSPRLAQKAWKVPLSLASRHARTGRNPGCFQRMPARLKRR
jgi:hypothetical protein